MNVMVSPSSSALSVMMSSFPAHLSILDMFCRLMPSARFRSQRKWSKPVSLSKRETRATWLESMACSAIPVSEQSKLVSVTRSLMASRTFFSREPCRSLPSNIVTAGRRNKGLCMWKEAAYGTAKKPSFSPRKEAAQTYDLRGHPESKVAGRQK